MEVAMEVYVNRLLALKLIKRMLNSILFYWSLASSMLLVELLHFLIQKAKAEAYRSRMEQNTFQPIYCKPIVLNFFNMKRTEKNYL